MGLAPSNSNVLWVGEWYPGQIEGNLWKSTNALNGTSSPGTVTWTQMDNGANALPNRVINTILVDPSNSDIVYVGFSDFKNDNLWRTSNGGTNWTDITGGGSTNPCAPNEALVGLPCAPVRAIARDPSDAATLFVGTEIGIYVTKDTGATWRPVMEGPANVSITSLSFMKGSSTLLVGTYGRGTWTANLGTPTATPSPNPTASDNDFDGDGRSDLAVVRATASPAGLTWHVSMTTDGYDSQAFGLPGDSITPGDYDGDGKVDITVFRAASEEWYVMKSTDSTMDIIELGEAGDIPVPADYDGDGVTDAAVWRPSTAYWYVEQSTNGWMGAQWGAEEDTPVAADFNGDGHADLGVFELKPGGYWELYFVTSHGSDEIQFGLEGDIPVAGDYDGDGHADVAIWRPDYDESGNGCWYILHSIGGYEDYDTIPWGVSTDVPVPGDYDGDGRMDVAVWRPGTGMWHIRESSNGYYSALFGADGDTPVGMKTSSGGARPFGPAHARHAPTGARPQPGVHPSIPGKARRSHR